MKRYLKSLTNGSATLVVLPTVFIYQLGRLLFGPQRAFPGWSQAFSLLPGFLGIYLRRAFYRLVLPRCDTDSCLSFGTVFSHPTARVGKSVYVGPYCCLGDITL